MKYRRKSNVIEAVELTRAAWTLAKATKKEDQTLEQKILSQVSHAGGLGFSLETPSGIVTVTPGDFVVFRKDGDYYPIKRDNFLELYELSDGATDDEELLRVTNLLTACQEDRAKLIEKETGEPAENV